MSRPVELTDAIRHLRARVAHIDSVDSRHRPHWTQADLDAAASIVDIPASAEQIALARIEGLSSNGGWPADCIKAIRLIARRALGLPT